MTTAAASERLGLGTITIYALPMIPMGFMGGLVSMYLLKFSTDVLLLAPGIMGLLFGISRIWDAVSDPMAGYWSDRTRSSLGRRRPWLLWSAVPLALLFVALWSPPSSLGSDALVLWMGAAILLFYTAQTALGIPHLALGAELSLDYHERSRVFGGRMIFDFLGIFLAAGALALLEPAADQRSMATLLTVGGGVLVVSLVMITGLRLRERPEFQGRGPESPVAAFRDVLGNRHARLLLAVFALDQLGFAALITTLPYLNQYILGESGITGGFVAAAITAALLMYPVWFPLSRRFGKRNPWIVATAIKAVAYATMFIVEPGDWLLIGGVIVLIGGVQGAGGILGPSMQADVIDVDEYQTGQRKEGAYFAMWNLATKAAAGFAVILVGLFLQLANFEPNVAPGPNTELAIRALVAGFPCLFHGLAAALLLRFDLDAESHAKIRAALDQRSLETSAA